jgi:D-glycero-D-manno-heptose 1,7-bisphosphate phosphatase
MSGCVFLDRDGVINEAPPAGEYILRPEDLHLRPRIAEWIRLFNELELRVIVITNQRCISSGLLSQPELRQIHARMTSLLQKEGASLDDIFFCPHALGSCGCRKPMPGMIQAAREKWNIDLASSLIVGDSESDRLLAVNCGVRFIHASELDKTIPDLFGVQT